MKLITKEDIAEFDRAVEATWPHIEWRQSVGVESAVDGTQRIACRLCIARLGLKGSDIATSPFVFVAEADFDAHMRETHR